MNIDPDFDVQHRDCFESLQAMADAGGADLIMFSPPYPDARKVEAYGAEFETSLDSYGRLGDAVFAALKPGGVCALNIDGPVRIWRPELGESERSLVSFEVAIDWTQRVGFRYVERCVYARDGFPTGHPDNPRWRSGHELVHVMSRSGSAIQFDRWGSTRSAKTSGTVKQSSRGRCKDGWHVLAPHTQGDRRTLMTSEHHTVNAGTTDRDHEAPFASTLADDYVRCYGPPGGIIGDPFVGSGTVAFAVHRAGEGRRFIGGDLGIRKTHRGKACGRRWADIVNDGLRQGRLFS